MQVTIAIGSPVCSCVVELVLMTVALRLLACCCYFNDDYENNNDNDDVMMTMMIND